MFRAIVNGILVYKGTLENCRVKVQNEECWLIQVKATDVKNSWIDYNWKEYQYYGKRN